MTVAARDELLALCRGRDLSGPAFAELVRLYREGTDDELREAVVHLRHLRIVDVGGIEPCEATTALLLPRLDAQAERAADHRQRIERIACALGRRLVRYDVTLAEAEHQLERLCDQRDRDRDVRLVPYWSAKAAAEAGFRAGFDAASGEAA